MTSTQDLGWLLANFADRVPGVAHAIAVSADGLLLAASRDLPRDRADQLAAIAAGIQSLSLSASAEFGDVLGTGQSMVEFRGGLLLIVPAGEGANLAVIASDDADVGVVGHNMNELVEQLGQYLTAPPRQARRSTP